ncbi:MAG: hypothetical protein BGN92_14480 [Sphingobacteriales bacterium 41-5]|nr:MAG: hypothetical protein BGN92_14480 [Sphingobacteriales bacterium 41-5]
MKTIINITLGGRNIAIEDSAFEKIKAYTESLRQYYRNEEGRDEIITDIESRFSELMQDKIRKGAAHITDADVDEMIATMGRPEDFDKDAKDESSSQNYSGPNFTTGEKRRLYRDESNKVIGGVCSGIANWLNIDPTVVRVLFAIISFGGFGSGILVYILLWIFLPAKNMSVYNGKKMYRNPDDKVIGGVAGGIGAYFNINPTTIRWVLAIPLIISALKGVHFFNWDSDFAIFPNIFFGSLSGTFIFAYIVLWIILPEANTPYQKMEMHGKTIDVNTIKENVQNSMGDFKDRMQSWSEEVKQAGDRIGTQVNTFAQKRGPEFGKEFGRAAARGGKGIGYAIAMIFRAFFIFIAGTIVVSLFIAFLAFLFSGFAWAPINNFLWTSDNQQMWAWGTLLFFVGAPIIGMLVSLTRMILNIRTPGNYLNWLFGGLWTVGWICLVMFIASVSKDLKRIENVETPINITQPSNGKMILTVNQPELAYQNRDYRWLNGGNDLGGFNFTPDTLKLSMISFDFEKSEDSLYRVIVAKEALGKTDEEARSRANKIQYSVVSKDSSLDLSNGFAIDKNSKYRFQNVNVKIQVPVGKKIKIDPSVFQKLSDGQIMARDYSDSRRGGLVSFKRRITGYEAGVDYVMDSTGKLVNPDKKTVSTNTDGENYSWKANDDTTKVPAVPVPPVAPAVPQPGGVYRYDAQPVKPAADPSKEDIKKVLEQKQKEIDDLKKKLGE